VTINRSDRTDRRNEAAMAEQNGRSEKSKRQTQQVHMTKQLFRRALSSASEHLIARALPLHRRCVQTSGDEQNAPDPLSDEEVELLKAHGAGALPRPRCLAVLLCSTKRCRLV